MKGYKRVIVLILCIAMVAMMAMGVTFTLLTTPLQQRLRLVGVKAEDFDCVTVYRHREKIFVWSSDDPRIIGSLLDAHRQGVSIVHPRPAVGEYLSFHFQYKHSVDGKEDFVIGMIGPDHYVTEDGQFLALFGGHTDEKWTQLLEQCNLEIW